MQERKNRQNLFAWQTVPETPPRPQSAIDFDLHESLHRNRYQSQLIEKMRFASTRKVKPADSVPQKETPTI